MVLKPVLGVLKMQICRWFRGICVYIELPQSRSIQLDHHVHRVTCPLILLSIFALSGCQSGQQADTDTTRTSSLDARLLQPQAHPPQWPVGWSPTTGQERPDDVPTISLAPNGMARTTVAPTIIDTRNFPVAIQSNDPWEGGTARPGTLLPAHKRDKTMAPGPQLDLPLGGLLAESRVDPAPVFPGISQTPWTPPDPTLAVGPDHIVSTVNMAIAFYQKDGTLDFFANLDSTGSPGFFEELGSGTFTFDPKCFYDHYTDRFFVLALEYYDGSNESWITVAVSDDSDPNGVWYKYRTWSVFDIEGTAYWVVYPGLGFIEDTFYSTGNLFRLSGGGPGFRGAIYRLYPKGPMLVGDPVTWTDLNDTGSASVQCAQVYEGQADTPPYFISNDSNSSLKIQSIRMVGGQPELRTTSVAIPSHGGGPPNGSNPGGSIDSLDGRLMNAHWRDGQLYTGHAIESGNQSESRWYHFDTGDWPGSSGNPSPPVLVQSGAIDLPGTEHSFFPAIASNKHDDVGFVIGHCQSSILPNVRVTGRMASDPAGTMGTPEVVVESDNGADGRWGDYFDLTVDPVDDTTFWYIGEWASSGGWQTWIGSFIITEPGCDGDTNGDNLVNVGDLLQVIAVWGTDCNIGNGCDEDIDGSGFVDVGDLLLVIANWGNDCGE